MTQQLEIVKRGLDADLPRPVQCGSQAGQRSETSAAHSHLPSIQQTQDRPLRGKSAATLYAWKEAPFGTGGYCAFIDARVYLPVKFGIDSRQIPQIEKPPYLARIQFVCCVFNANCNMSSEFSWFGPNTTNRTIQE
jgi:hypothetical protein